MQISRRTALGWTMGVAGATAVGAHAAVRPQPRGALPSARQLAWHGLDRYAFIHFSMNTFTNREWGYGSEQPSQFAPSDFSADQIASVIAGAGLERLILTAKHHDGFCLWPSAYGQHTIAASPYKNGKGDIVGELAEASRRHGLSFGLYLSPWDRNHAQYGRPEYVEYYHNQLTELLSRYGKVSEVWFDGANGGDGYYGGANETRRIDGSTYYQWDTVRSIVRKLQPDAVMFADAHMDIRWVGNEDGIAGDPCWPTVDTRPFTRDIGNHGIRDGSIWNPAETDVSIRPGWFWHEDENDKVRSPANLMELYFASVGRGSNLLLNVPPDRTGRINAADIKALTGFRDLLDRMHAAEVSKGARFTVSSQLGSGYGATQVNGKGWAAAAGDTVNPWIEMSLPAARAFDVVSLREDIRYGIHVDTFVVEIEDGGTWRQVAQAACIGPKRLIRLDAPVTAKRIRVRMPQAMAAPVLTRFMLYRLPEIVAEPNIFRDASGQVHIEGASGETFLYGLNGAEPRTVYSGPFDLSDGGTIVAMARSSSGVESARVTMNLDIPHTGWTVVSANGTGAQFLIAEARKNSDGFVAAGVPAEIVIDLGRSATLAGFSLTPIADNPHDAAPPAGYSAWVSSDGKTWGDPAAIGEFANIASNRITQKVRFAKAVSGRYLRLSLSRPVLDKPKIAVGGISVLTK